MTSSGSNSLDFQCSEAVGVVDKTQLVRVDIEHSRLVLETNISVKKEPIFPAPSISILLMFNVAKC